MCSPYGAASLATGAAPVLRALIAVPHVQQATALARALLSVRLLPTLRFTARDVHAYLEVDSFAVLVLGLPLDELEPALLIAGVRRRSHVPILALGPERLPAEHICRLRCDRYVPDRLPPAAVARSAVELTRPPPLWRDVSVRQVHTWGALQLDPSRRLACWHGRPISPTSMQFRLLLTLVQARGAVVSAVELSRHVWGTDLPHDTERVVAHVRRIRKLLEPDPAHPRFLLTVRGEGFRLADPSTAVTRDRASAVPPPLPGWVEVSPAVSSLPLAR